MHGTHCMHSIWKPRQCCCKLLRSKGKNTVDGTHRNLIENERQCCCKLLKSKVNNTKRWLSTIVCVCNWRWCRLFLRYRWCSLLMISLAALRHSIVNQQCKINPPPRFLSSWWIQYYRVGQNQNRMNKPYVNTTPYFKYNTWWFPRQKRRLYNVYIYIYIYMVLVNPMNTTPVRGSLSSSLTLV